MIRGWKALSFNQKASLLVQAAIAAAACLAAVASWTEQVKAKEPLQETQKLTEQNKRIAIATVESLNSGLSGVIATEQHDDVRFSKSQEDLLKKAGASPAEIDKILGQASSARKGP